MLNSFLGKFIIDGWVLLGFLGQGLFFSRMMTQWLYSEKKKESAIPSIYWYLSLAGSGIITLYAYQRGDLVIFAGQIIAFFIYLRNIMLIRQKQKE